MVIMPDEPLAAAAGNALFTLTLKLSLFATLIDEETFWLLNYL